MIQKAAEFAAHAHAGALRKGSKLPYIVHPREVAMIVAMMTDDPEVIAAAYLHDVMKDAGVRYEELEEQFGKRVADLVRSESENKALTWKERKQATIDRMKQAPKDVKMIAFGDKLSNLRSTTTDYLIMEKNSGRNSTKRTSGCMHGITEAWRSRSGNFSSIHFTKNIVCSGIMCSGI